MLNYVTIPLKSFLINSCCHSQFQKVNQSTEKLTSGLTTLKEKCLEFSETAQSLSTARRLTSLALSRHTQLLEILELPQLMDTCVRNGYWEEALELASYVARLERKLGYIPLIVVCKLHYCPRGIHAFTIYI